MYAGQPLRCMSLLWFQRNPLPMDWVAQWEVLERLGTRSGYLPSTTRATSRSHSAQAPTNNMSPLWMLPLKLVIVVSWRQCPHPTLDSSR